MKKASERKGQRSGASRQRSQAAAGSHPATPPAESPTGSTQVSFRDRFEAIASGVVVHDAQGRITYANPAACQILGLQPNQLLGRTPNDPYWHTVHEDGSPFAGDDHPALVTLRTREPVHDLVMGISASPSEPPRWVLVHCEPLFGPDAKEIEEVVVTLVDITRRMRTELALSALTEEVASVTGEAFFRSLVRHLAESLGADYAMVGELAGKRGERVNAVAMSVRGQVGARFEYELAGTPCENVVAQRVCSYPSGVRSRFPKDHLLAELGVESFVGTPLFDSAGNPLGLIVVMDRKPLSDPQLAESMLRIFAARAAAELERKRAEETLLRTEALYRQAITETGSVPYQRDYSTPKFAFLGPGIEELTGYTADELTGPLFGTRLRKIDFYGPGAELPHAERVRLAREGVLRKWRADYLFEKKDGTLVWLSDASVPLFDETGKPIGSLGILTDITQRKQMEEELQKVKKLESLGLLAGGIAHDFNNILTAITGLISLAKLTQPSEEELLAILDDAEQAAFRARDLTQQLLAFARGGAPVKRSGCIRDLLIESMTFTLRGSKVRCEFEVPDDLWAVEMDEGQIHQVINNLALNALQAMPEGGIVRVRCDNVVVDPKTSEPPVPLHEGRYVRVSITDHGSGIASEDLPRIFDPYFSTKPEGSGLGLAVSYRIVQNHGGYLGVESEVGVGSTFTLYLPASEERPQPQPSEQEAPGTGRGRVLLLDDEEVVRQVATRILSHIGLEVDSAADGHEAIERYQKAMAAGQPYDAVIMDLTIPAGMGGKETIRRLLEIDPEVKAIVSSGYSNDPVMASYEEYGFVGVVSKPYSVGELSKAVLEVIHR